MRKQLLLMLILCLSATMVWAERIDVSTARKVAENVANAGSGLRSAGDLSLVYAAAPENQVLRYEAGRLMVLRTISCLTYRETRGS